jgi:hypothetical protein
MTPNERGRHCDSCNKTVIDFTLYSDKELIEFFKKVSGRVCGHMPTYQLNRVIAVQENNRNTFFKKLFWGTAIASWLGLADKADAQAIPNPAKTEQTIKANKVISEKDDTLKAYLTLTFIDSTAQQNIPYMGVTVNSDTFSEYAQADEKGKVKLNILQSMIGKKVSLMLETSMYLYKSIEITVPSTPLHKKVYVIEQRRQMLNGEIMMVPKDTAIKD